MKSTTTILFALVAIVAMLHQPVAQARDTGNEETGENPAQSTGTDVPTTTEPQTPEPGTTGTIATGSEATGPETTTANVESGSTTVVACSMTSLVAVGFAAILCRL